MFQSKSLWLSKDAGFPCDDAHAIDASKGLAAVADGVSAALFSGLWARVLVQAIVDNPYEPGADLREWLKPLQKRWRESVDFSKLNYFQQMKLQETGGSFSTLLWVRIVPDSLGLKAYAYSYGDCNCFHLRDGEVIRTFPFKASTEFDLTPVQLGTSIRANEGTPPASVSFECLPGDVLVLATDAIAHWYFHCVEQNQPFNWLDFNDMDEANWYRVVDDYRKAGMRCDDTTVLVLQLEAVSLRSPTSVCQKVLTSAQARRLARQASKRRLGVTRRRLARLHPVQSEQPAKKLRRLR